MTETPKPDRKAKAETLPEDEPPPRPGFASRLGFWLLLIYALGLSAAVIEYLVSHIAIKF